MCTDTQVQAHIYPSDNPSRIPPQVSRSRKRLRKRINRRLFDSSGVSRWIARRFLPEKTCFPASARFLRDIVAHIRDIGAVHVVFLPRYRALFALIRSLDSFLPAIRFARYSFFRAAGLRREQRNLKDSNGKIGRISRFLERLRKQSTILFSF